MLKAVLWDFGGVITSSPFEAFNRFEEENNLPRNVIRSINANNPETNAWAQLESSAISVDEFDDRFAEEARAIGHSIRGRQVLKLLSGEIRPEMVRALEIIGRTLKIGCITNNVKFDRGPGTRHQKARSQGKAGAVAQVMAMFDVVIESSKAGMRKPDPRIYTLACKQLDIAPVEAVFLDDLGINLKPARQLGMITIKVLSPRQALTDLEQHLGISLG